MDRANGFIWTLVDGFDAAYILGRPLPPEAQALFAGLGRPPDAAAWAVWECAGISVCRSVTVCSPPVSPKSRKLNPGPWPACMGAQPCRLGRAKLLVPLPP